MFTIWFYNGHYLVIKWQFTESRNVFSPFYQNEQLLFHGLADVRYGGRFLLQDIRRRCGVDDVDLQRDRQSAEMNSLPQSHTSASFTAAWLLLSELSKA